MDSLLYEGGKHEREGQEEAVLPAQSYSSKTQGSRLVPECGGSEGKEKR